MRAAINDLLKILITILSDVGIWGLGVKEVLMFDDRTVEVGVSMSKGLAVRVALEEFRGRCLARDELGEVDDGFTGVRRQ